MMTKNSVSWLAGLAILAGCAAPVPPAPLAPPAAPAAKPMVEKPVDQTADAQAAALAWLALADAGKYADTWAQTSDSFQRVVPREGWEPALRSVRAPLGALKSRALKSAEYKASIPGAPAGEYVVIQYASAFENRAGVVETITPVKGKDGGWRVSGYYVK